MWNLGQTSKKYEVGRNGSAATISTGAGDRGGVSYGLYQMSSKIGVVSKFVEVMGYSDEFKGLTPATPAFNRKWVELAKNDKFAEDQHEFIKKTHFVPQVNFLKSNGIDLSERGAAVLDAIWSVSVQFGPNTSLIVKALRGKDTSRLSDREIVGFIQEYKINNNSALFKSSSSAVRSSTLARAKDELKSLLALCDEQNETRIV